MALENCVSEKASVAFTVNQVTVTSILICQLLRYYVSPAEMEGYASDHFIVFSCSTSFLLPSLPALFLDFFRPMGC
jgi:hypothetical protein